MPKPPMRPSRDVVGYEDEDDEDDDKFFMSGQRSLLGDELSRITEGSREGDSVATSAYFSAVSGSVHHHQGIASLASSLKLAQQQQQLRAREPPREGGSAAPAGGRQPPGAQCRGAATGGGRAVGGGGGGSAKCAGDLAGGDAGARPVEGGGAAASGGGGGVGRVAVEGGSELPGSPEGLKQMVKAFVESGVRGRRLVAMRRDGRPQSVMFRLTREVDAFELAAEGGCGYQRVELAEVVAACTGGDSAARDLSETMPGLDSSCAIVDLRDGRCITLRFATTLEASTFVRCMLIFAQEVRKERRAVSSA